MDLTCSQIEMLISFYFNEELKDNLKNKVEEHLQACPICRAKYKTFVNLINGLKSEIGNFENKSSEVEDDNIISNDYKTNVSAYIDNELNDEDNIKIKKLTINNKSARKYLEDSYALRNVISNSFEKNKNDMRHDFSKNVLMSLEIEDEDYKINPIIKGISVAFTVLLFGTIFTAVILNVGW